MKLERGLIQVYTGNGKGKTTAALGLAFRAAGREPDIVLREGPWSWPIDPSKGEEE